MSKVSRIHLHIGLEKTGTTYIQNTLGENANKLLKVGWFYPKMLNFWNHHALPALILGAENIQEIHHAYGGENIDFEYLRRQIKNCLEERPRNNHQILICSEHLSSRLRDESHLQKLRDFLAEISEDITVSLFIRRQDKMMEATYSTAIKNSATNTFQLEKHLRMVRRYNFYHLVQLWEKFFPGKVSVGLFNEKWKDNPEKLFPAFLDLAKIPKFDVNLSAELANKKLGVEQILQLIEINTLAKNENSFSVIRAKKILINYFERYPVDSGDFMSNSDRFEVWLNFLHSNLLIADYLKDDEVVEFLADWKQ